MIGSKKLSIIKYLSSLLSFRFLPRNRFYWLLLLSSTPLLFGSSTVVSIAAPQQKIAQVVVGASMNRPTLKIGSRGVPVRELQGALKLLGFYGGEVNGIFTQITRTAVIRFQQAAGLKADGVVDTNTWKTLFPSVTTSTEVTNTPAPPPSTNNFPMPTESINSVRVVNNSTQQQNGITSTVNSSVRVVNPTPEPKPATPVKPKPTKTTTRRKPAQRQAATTRTRQTTTTRQRSTTTKRKTPVIQYTAAGLPILRPGMRGSQVVKLQEKLSRLGFLKGVDGDFGPVTTEAVKAFQKRNGLEPDGIVGGATWNLLDKRRR
ncbi:MAG: peptidoglycan-binding domain-containing protein [Cyanobacteria bacterium P01_D01_bin.50]